MNTLFSIVPLFKDIISNGGFVMYPIIGISILTWILGLYKLINIAKIEYSFKRFCKDYTKSGWSPFDNFKSNLSNQKVSAKSFSSIYHEMMIDTIPSLESGFSSMSSLITTAPLLGLLGTVIGMIQTFAVIMQYGIGNPHMMAEGISIALLTTQAGLTAAFPGMLFHNWLIERKENLISDINKQVNTLNTIQN